MIHNLSPSPLHVPVPEAKMINWQEELDRALTRLAQERVEAMTPADILGQAADLLESGWCKGGLIKNGNSPIDRKMCSIGAINMVSLGSERANISYLNRHNWTARREAIRVLAEQVQPDSLVYGNLPVFIPESVVMSWNDQRDQTADEVIHQFRIAEKIAKGE